jgi:hypothetical protein
MTGCIHEVRRKRCSTGADRQSTPGGQRQQLYRKHILGKQEDMGQAKLEAQDKVQTTEESCPEILEVGEVEEVKRNADPRLMGPS